MALAGLAMVYLCGPWAGAAAQAGYPVAGTAPHQRPVVAPTITAAPKDADWYSKALTGVTRPYPFSLRFLEDQGAWDLPFAHPGMTGPYDIRGWHRRPLEAGQ